VLSLFIIGHMGLFFYNKIGSIISIVDLPTTNIIEPIIVRSIGGVVVSILLSILYMIGRTKYVLRK
ncbi:hypothetical protein, partial [Streptococcus pneumoniae]|uniref:hypothetical protein n=1 Tax=Streptococcus pneumoniae TaxID=1313 RepID=UPI00067C1C4F